MKDKIEYQLKEWIKRALPKQVIEHTMNAPYSIFNRCKSFEAKNTISLFCDPRGGSTWLAESLLNLPKSIIIDEPIHPVHIKEFKSLNFGWRQMIPDTVEWIDAKNVFSKIISGKLIERSTCVRNTWQEMFIAQQLIIKYIRGKALLPWYVNQFDFRFDPILLVRHPFAVASSQIEHPSWNYSYTPFSVPETPFNEIYKMHIKFLESLTTKEEQLTAIWCISNLIPLKHPKNNKRWITLSYEELVTHPAEEFKKIFNRWKIEMPEQLLKNLYQPSSSALTMQISPEIQLVKWQKLLSKKQIYQLRKVLDYFEIDFYDEDPMPKKPLQNL